MKPYETEHQEPPAGGFGGTNAPAQFGAMTPPAPGPPPRNHYAVYAISLGVAGLPLTMLCGAFCIPLAFAAIATGVLGFRRSKEHSAAPGRMLSLLGLTCGVLTLLAMTAFYLFFVIH